ncbi:hypothetical protein [Herbaspirillum huttiense]|uniref:hypothetical protein n=1 Tax=Herbaspirillum huttiense TaxID=863372 RepID=UPI002176E66C|nr:hypothetical protein [Herbaspirillum huttiense]UWE18073.1 hypothetical protein NY669_07835 [Herbaspirillum huttiense]
MKKYKFLDFYQVVINFVAFGTGSWFVATYIVTLKHWLLASDSKNLTFVALLKMIVGAWFSPLLAGILWLFAMVANVYLLFCTIAPIALSSLAYWYIMQWVPNTSRVGWFQKTRWLVVSSIICALISTMSFYSVAMMLSRGKFFNSDYSLLMFIGAVGTLIGLVSATQVTVKLN